MELTVAWRMPSRPKEQGNLNVHSTNRALDVPSTHLFTFSAADFGSALAGPMRPPQDFRKADKAANQLTAEEPCSI
jgi:hypothetical protein